MDDKALAPIDLDAKKTVKKSNVLNELRNANASLVEYRLFCVYLAHLPMGSDSNTVTFRLSDYAKIAGLKRPRKDDLEAQSENLISMTAKVDGPDGGFRRLALFSEFKLHRQDDEWMVSLECNPKIAPMIREQKGKFLRYKLYNTIFLKSFNQQRLYELLKQYERIGERTISLKDLREYLSIEEHQYPVWSVFARDVLQKSQTALKENTDICFEYEPIKKGRPVVAVRFIISKNQAFEDRLQIDEHLPDAGDAEDYDGDELCKRAPELPEDADQASLFVVSDYAASVLLTLMPELKDAQAQALGATVELYFASMLPDGVSPSLEQISAYIKQQVNKLRAQQKRQHIPRPVAYLQTMLENDAKAAASGKGAIKPTEQARTLDEDEQLAVQRLMADADLLQRAEELKAKLAD